MSVTLFPYAKATHCDHGVKLTEDCLACAELAVKIRYRDLAFGALLSIPFWFVIYVWLIGG